MLRVPPTFTFSKREGRIIIESGQAMWKIVRGRDASMVFWTASWEEMSQVWYVTEGRRLVEVLMSRTWILQDGSASRRWETRW